MENKSNKPLAHDPNDSWLSVKQVAEQLEMSEHFVYAAAHLPRTNPNHIKAVWMGGARIRIKQSWLNEYLSRMEEESHKKLNIPAPPPEKRQYRKKSQPKPLPDYFKKDPNTWVPGTPFKLKDYLK